MGLFSLKKENDFLRKENLKLLSLMKENAYLRKENLRLDNLCKEKDSFFLELISDGLRHGSSLAAQHMADRKKYIQGK